MMWSGLALRPELHNPGTGGSPLDDVADGLRRRPARGSAATAATPSLHHRRHRYRRDPGRARPRAAAWGSCSAARTSPEPVSATGGWQAKSETPRSRWQIAGTGHAHGTTAPGAEQIRKPRPRRPGPSPGDRVDRRPVTARIQPTPARLAPAGRAQHWPVVWAGQPSPPTRRRHLGPASAPWRPGHPPPPARSRSPLSPSDPAPLATTRQKAGRRPTARPETARPLPGSLCWLPSWSDLAARWRPGP